MLTVGHLLGEALNPATGDAPLGFSICWEKKKINMLKLLSFHVPQSRAEYTNKLLTEFDVPKRVALNKQRCGLDFMEEMGLWALRL